MAHAVERRGSTAEQLPDPEAPHEEPHTTPEAPASAGTEAAQAREAQQQWLDAHCNEVAARALTEQDANTQIAAAEEALRAAIELARLDPNVEDVLGIRAAKLRLEDLGTEDIGQPEDAAGAQRAQIDQLIETMVDGARQSLEVAASAWRQEIVAGRKSVEDASAALRAQVEKLIMEQLAAFRKIDQRTIVQPKKPRPIQYGRSVPPPVQRPRAA